MKDMALEEDVLKMPAYSLKIEGRKKSPLYVAAVTDFYRRLLDGKGASRERADNIRQIFPGRGASFISRAKTKRLLTGILSGTAACWSGRSGRLQKGGLSFVRIM